MLGSLSKSQIDNLLRSQLVGRIGCHADGKTYVVPVNYAIEGKYIYLYTTHGLKLDMMRKNPHVCFEVDEIESLANWRSAIGWGLFEEMKGATAQAKGVKIIKDRLSPYLTHETFSSKQQSVPPLIVEKKIQTIIYRIKIMEVTGRFEKPV
jgi:nitroimidazol reductase NimA-like FMN-containing flavoprotein (pyridoxamine 5'-phosphate oxidase superfamily)